MAAHINSFGAEEVSNGPAIVVKIGAKGKDIGFQISDEGGGMSKEVLFNCFRYFYTTVVAPEPTYTYSGSFGVPFHGEGVGLKIARQYARFLGGDISLGTLPGHGTTANVILDRFGSAEI
jgi:pyruvate dehydrogenase kinase 2/3/4